MTKRPGIYILIVVGVVVLLVADLRLHIAQPNDDRHAKAEKLRIADACYAMLHSSLTNDDDIGMDDPRIPEVIRALHPFHIDVIQGFDVEIYRTGRPSEYFLTRLPGYTNTWVLCVDDRSRQFSGRGREIAKIEPEQIVRRVHHLH